MKIIYSWVAFFCSLLTLVSINIYRVTNKDQERLSLPFGFDLQKWYIMLLLAVCLIIPLSVYFSKDSKRNILVKQTVLTQVLTLVLGIAVFLESILPLSTENPSFALKISSFLVFAVGLLTSIALVCIFVFYILGKPVSEKHPLFYILPMIWMVIRLFERRTYYNSVAKSLTEMFDFFVIGMAGLFLYYLAKVLTGVINKTNKRNLFIFGMLFIIFALTYNSGYVIESFEARKLFQSSVLFSVILDLVLVIYAAAYLFQATVCSAIDSQENLTETAE